MTSRSRRYRLFAVIVHCVPFVYGAMQAAAAPPTIGNLSLRGLQAGGTTTLTISGGDLLPEPRIVMAVPIAQQVVKEPAAPNEVRIDVTLDAATPPGVYQLRLATAQGISAPLAVAIDRLPELPFAAEVASLPAALNGSLQGAAVLRTSFTGMKGRQVVIDLEARRLGVDTNAVLHLLDARNVQLAYSYSVVALAGDPRIVATLPVDGRYTVELHDLQYRGAAPGTFRLKLGALHYADLPFPLGVQRGTKALLGFVSSNLPAEARVESADVPLAGVAPAPWPADELLTGARPRLIYSDYDELVETAMAPGELRKVTPPVGVSGRLALPREEDRYQLAVTPGQSLRFDVLAARLGSPLDGVVSVRNAAGAELAGNDDRPGTSDPGLDFAVPAGVDTLVVAISERTGRGGPEFVYRLGITALGRPDFSLTLFADRQTLPRGGAAVARVRANRAGYNGPIKLSIAGLPAGVTLTGDEIPAGATDTLLSLLPGDQVMAPLLTTLVGASTEANTSIQRLAQTAETPASKPQPWLRGEWALAGAQPLPLAVAWGPASADLKLPLGAGMPAEIQLLRAAGVAGAVKLSLLSSQIIPKKTIKENNVDKQVDDLDRALRLDGAPVIAAEQTAGTATLLVPGDLPNIPYDVAIQADLLAADGATVVASAVTPARRVVTAQPLTIELAGEAKVEAKAGSGESGKLTGKLARLGVFKQPVVVTLEGLPPELPPPEIALAPEQNEFVLPVAFPFGSPQGAIANISLVAVSRLNPPVVVKSNAIPVAVTVVAGGPPPALYKLFEDEPHFLSLLTEGSGQATLDAADRYAGTAALRVTPDQKFRLKLPGLGVKIVEKPGDGEYRFLRFAWKKRGGANILFQLAANGAFGPAVGGAGPSFRYEAGPSPNGFKAAALKLDDKLPDGWVIVTRDLFADFGPFSLDGLAFTAGDGEAALFDHIYLARTTDDLKGCPEPVKP
ncbi:MAG TPA: hypothetical protein VMV69_21410 [Pirellulales bacterium]|nr:hypothetical protein [Pirellulales bacterium]